MVGGDGYFLGQLGQLVSRGVGLRICRIWCIRDHRQPQEAQLKPEAFEIRQPAGAEVVVVDEQDGE